MANSSGSESPIILVQEEPIMMTQLIEIPVTQAGQKIKLPDVQQLRSQEGQTIIIKSLHLVTPKVLTNAMTLALPNAPATELVKICLVLYSMQWERGQQIPLLWLNDMADGDSTAATTIPYRNKSTILNDWRNVDWAQSYLLFGNGTVSVPSYAVLINCCYLKLDGNGKPIVTPS